jgi:hypothetical protein
MRLKQQQSCPTKKSPGLLQYSTEPFKEKLTPKLLKLFHKIERGGTLPKSFFKISIILYQNQKTTQQKRKIIDKFSV